jgi:hypothetical protein
MADKNMTMREMIKAEYARCAIDPVYFMRKYCKIQHPVKGRMLFDLFPFQEDMMEDLEKNQFNIILKSRQLGISTLSAGFSLYKMLFTSDYNVLVIATRHSVAMNLVKKVLMMYEGLPSWLKPSVVSQTKTNLVFRNGSQIKAVSSSPDAGRSEALSLLVIDEAAFIRHAEEIWASAQQTLTTGGQAIILSTPNGVGNFFHKQWVNATTKGTMNPIKLHWTVHPERDQVWRDRQDDLLGDKLAGQECDCDFVSSGNTVIDSEDLIFFKGKLIDPIEVRGVNGEYWLWEYPDYSKQYVVSADVARGDGSDFSAFQVFEVNELRQVAEFNGVIGTTEFAQMLYAVATEWNTALLSVENANIGWAVIQELINSRYRNLYHSSNNKVYREEDAHKYEDNSKLTPGFTLTSANRPLIIAKMQQLLRERDVIINSSRLNEQLFTFIWNGNKAEAASGYNDDMVMAFAELLWVRDTAIRMKMMGVELTRKTLSNTYKNVISVRRTNNKRTQWDAPDGSDLKWLL